MLLRGSVIYQENDLLGHKAYRWTPVVANSHSPERIHTTWSAFTDENTPRPVSFQ